MEERQRLRLRLYCLCVVGGPHPAIPHPHSILLGSIWKSGHPSPLALHFSFPWDVLRAAPAMGEGREDGNPFGDAEIEAPESQ